MESPQEEDDTPYRAPVRLSPPLLHMRVPGSRRSIRVRQDPDTENSSDEEPEEQDTQLEQVTAEETAADESEDYRHLEAFLDYRFHETTIKSAIDRGRPVANQLGRCWEAMKNKAGWHLHNYRDNAVVIDNQDPEDHRASNLPIVRWNKDKGKYTWGTYKILYGNCIDCYAAIPIGLSCPACQKEDSIGHIMYVVLNKDATDRIQTTYEESLEPGSVAHPGPHLKQRGPVDAIAFALLMDRPQVWIPDAYQYKYRRGFDANKPDNSVWTTVDMGEIFHKIKDIEKDKDHLLKRMANIFGLPYRWESDLFQEIIKCVDDSFCLRAHQARLIDSEVETLKSQSRKRRREEEGASRLDESKTESEQEENNT